MTNRSEAAKRAWATMRKKYPNGALARKAWATRRLNKIMEMDQNEYSDYITNQFYKEYYTDEHKRIRRLIIKTGGINDQDYEDIPRWAKRKNGRTLDLLISEIAEEVVPIHSADDLYELIREIETA